MCSPFLRYSSLKPGLANRSPWRTSRTLLTGPRDGVHPKHGANARCDRRIVPFLGEPVDLGPKAVTHRVQTCIQLRFFAQAPQDSGPGRGNQWVAVECPCHEDRTRLNIVFHQAHRLGSSTHRPKGKTTSCDLAVGTHIRYNPVELLSPAWGQTEAGDHFVKDQEGPDLAGDSAQLG